MASTKDEATSSAETMPGDESYEPQKIKKKKKKKKKKNHEKEEMRHDGSGQSTSEGEMVKMRRRKKRKKRYKIIVKHDQTASSVSVSPTSGESDGDAAKFSFTLKVTASSDVESGSDPMSEEQVVEDQNPSSSALSYSSRKEAGRDVTAKVEGRSCQESGKNSLGKAVRKRKQR